MGGRIRWSVIIPSYNGEDTLAACLDAVGALRSPAGEIEILLVDNASTDRTASMMEEFAERAGAQVLSEPRKGKSHALNTAIERSSGEMMLFLDDDVIADSKLIDAYDDAARDYPAAGVFAGQVRPSWIASPPGWLEALTDAGRSCGCTPTARGADWLDAVDVKGGNMAVRRAALGAHRFATEGVNFGASERATGGEDTELAGRVAGATRIRYVPGAVVSHIVAPHEMRWAGVFARYVRIGRASAAQGRLSRHPALLAAHAAIYACLAGAAFLLGRKQAAASQGIKLAMRMGALDYRRRPGIGG